MERKIRLKRMNIQFTLHLHILLLESSNPHVDTPVDPKVHWLKINPEMGDIYWMYVSSPLSFRYGMEVRGERVCLKWSWPIKRP